MTWRHSLARAGVLLALLGFSPLPALAQPVAQAQTLVIGVDHTDPANQQPEQHRVWEYTDFFARTVTVHTGDTLDFRTAPNAFHVVGLAPSDAAARAAYPVGGNDTEDPVKAIGTGLPKIVQGPGQNPIVGGSTQGGGTIGQPNSVSTCGLPGQQPCAYKGGNDVESAGGVAGFNPQTNQPAAVDWKIVIDAPPGTYHYLCFIHPGMTGTLNVVAASQPATTQAQLDSQSATQFAADQAAAATVEQTASVPKFTGGAPGSRTYQVLVGAAPPDGHVNLTEMLPRSLSLTQGDKINYVWQSPNEVHTVSFPAEDKRLNGPFGFDCGTTYQNVPEGPPSGNGPPFQPCVEPGQQAPELIGDPGTAPSGSALTDPSQILDSGFLVGTGYNITPAAQQWTVVTNGATKAGTYVYECTLHEGMVGTITITAGASVAQGPAQIPAQMPNTGAGGGPLLWGGLALLGALGMALGGVQLAGRRR